MRFFWILFCALPLPGFAEVLTVRGGEHDNFTRLVIPIERSRTWSLDQTSRDAELTVSGATFDTSQAFVRIGNQRVANVLTDGEKMTVQFSCNCVISPLVLDGYLALDVSENMSRSILPVITAGDLGDDFFHNRMPPIDSMESDLSRRIARAVGEGLLEVGNVGLKDPNIIDFGYRGMLVHTDLDIPPVNDNDKVPACPPADWMGYSDWGLTGDFVNDLVLARGSLHGELDGVKDYGVVSIVRVYFYYGLFDEVTSTIIKSGVDLPELEILRLVLSNDLKDMGSCGGQYALWSYLSGEDVDLKDIQVAFMQAPVDVRNRIGSEFIVRLLQDREADVAWSMLAYIDVDDDSYILSKARLLEVEGSWQEAADIYTSYLKINPSSYDVAVNLVEIASLGSLPLPRDALQLMADILGQSPQLKQPLAMIAARSGDYKLAGDLAKELKLEELDSQILDLAALNASDVDIVRLAFGVFPEQTVLKNASFVERVKTLGFYGSIPERDNQSQVAMPDLAVDRLSLKGSRDQLQRSSDMRQQIGAVLQGNGL